MRRAIIFDLDNTLYRERRFALSGFDAVAAEIERQYGVPRRAAFQVLQRALRVGGRHEALQIVCSRFRLPKTAVPALVDTFRVHRPWLKLSRTTRETLESLRPFWRLGLLTNGVPDVQRRKIEALSVASYVDVMVFAEEHGSGAGKPEARPFEVVLERLGVEASEAVFVGDDPRRDILGARRVGLRTIRVAWRRGGARPVDPEADAIVTTVAEVPEVAERLLRKRVRHAA